MAKNILLQQLSCNELVEQILATLQPNIIEWINNLKIEQDKELDFIPKKKVVSMLQVTSQTLHNWEKHEILVPYKIANRVFYKKADIVKAMKKPDSS